MTAAEIIFVSMTAAIAVVTLVINKFQDVLIERYKDLLNQCYKKLDEQYSKDDEVLKYCLVQIMKQSIEKEDYETANRCKDLLTNLHNPSTPTNDK